MKIQVITRIPDADKQDGNLCDETFLFDVCRTNKTIMLRHYHDIELYSTMPKMPVKLEVFHLGEIIVVDDNEREIGGWFRKASKWHVSYELFDIKDIEKAIKLSENVTNKYFK